MTRPGRCPDERRSRPGGAGHAGSRAAAASDDPAAPAATPGAAGKRSATEFGNGILQDRAAALAYYSIQSIFPGLLVLVSLLGLIGSQIPSR